MPNELISALIQNYSTTHEDAHQPTISREEVSSSSQTAGTGDRFNHQVQARCTAARTASSPQSLKDQIRLILKMLLKMLFDILGLGGHNNNESQAVPGTAAPGAVPPGAVPPVPGAAPPAPGAVPPGSGTGLFYA